MRDECKESSMGERSMAKRKYGFILLKKRKGSLFIAMNSNNFLTILYTTRFFIFASEERIIIFRNIRKLKYLCLLEQISKTDVRYFCLNVLI